MSIEPINGNGPPRASVSCDLCARVETVTCDYEHGSGGVWSPNMGQINTKLQGHGWALVKGKLHCPNCEARRKAARAAKTKSDRLAKEAGMTVQDRAAQGAAAPPREPTRAMRVDILVALAAAYDLNAQRYRGDATDRSVADLVGGGCMPGWVTAVRDVEFGPAGNEEVEAIRAELRRLDEVVTKAGRDIDAIIAQAGKLKDAFQAEMMAELAALSRKVDKAVGDHDKRVRV